MQRSSVLAGLALTAFLAACGSGGGDPTTLKVGSQRGGTKAVLIASGAL